MDLQSIVSGAIGTVNPNIWADYYGSTGSVTNADGSRSAAFASPVTLSVQKQEISFKDMQHVDGLNLQGIFCTVYLHGAAYGVVRGTAKGGDKFVINGETWLVVEVPEEWPDWCKIILNLQDDR